MFPADKDPTGGMCAGFSFPSWCIGLEEGRTDTADLLFSITDPAHWSESEMRIWLERVCFMMKNEALLGTKIKESI